MQQLNGLDSLLVLGDVPNIPLHISALCIYNPTTSASGKLSYTEIKTLLEKTINTSLPILQCKIEKLPFTIDKPYWVNDKNFNLDYHIERFALPNPANWAELHELVGHFHAQPLHSERPLWKALFLENLDNLSGIPKGSVGLVLKIHHALADGKTAFNIFSALHTLSPEPNAPLILQNKPNMALNLAAPNWSTKYSRAYWQAISSPFKLTQKLTALAPKLLSSNDDNKKSQSSIPDTPFNCEPSPDRIIRHIGMPIEKIHTIEKQSGCTINEIALCIIAGALRDYLLQQDKLPKESLVAGMPIDVRSKKNKAAIGNQISFANVCLYSDIENPKIRLACIHEASLASKQKNQKMGPKSLVAILDNIYPGVLVWAGKKLFEHHLFNKLPRLNNTIVTNVPGIPVPCYLCGAELVDYLGFGPLAPTTSLFHVISSIHSRINISFIGSSNSLKDPDSYMELLEKSYQALLKNYHIR